MFLFSFMGTWHNGSTYICIPIKYKINTQLFHKFSFTRSKVILFLIYVIIYLHLNHFCSKLLSYSRASGPWKGMSLFLMGIKPQFHGHPANYLVTMSLYWLTYPSSPKPLSNLYTHLYIIINNYESRFRAKENIISESSYIHFHMTYEEIW